MMVIKEVLIVKINQEVLLIKKIKEAQIVAVIK